MTTSKQISQPIWSPLRLKGFRHLWLGQLFSDVANWLDFVALNVLIVYVWGHGATAVAGLSICIGLPWIIVGTFLSPWLARIPIKRTMILCDILRAIIVASMIEVNSLSVLFLCVFLKMSVSAVFDPLRQGAIKQLVTRETLAQASSLSQLAVNMTKVIGPMIGGILVGWLGIHGLFIIGASCYALSAFILTGMPEKKGVQAYKSEAKSGLNVAWQYLNKQPLLKIAILYTSMLFFCIFLYDGLITVLTREAGMNENEFGMLIGSVGAGSVLGSLAAGHWSQWQARPMYVMTLAGAGSGILIFILGLSVIGGLPCILWLWLVIGILLGVSNAMSAVPLGFIIQKETTDQSISTVSALSNALQTASMLIAPIIGSLAAHFFGAGMVFLWVGLMISGLGILFRYRFSSKKEETPVIITSEM